MTAYLMSQHDYCHERGEDIKHKYLKKSSTQFFTQWVKIAKCVFKQIPELWFKIRMDIGPTFCSSTGRPVPVVGGERREGRQQKIRSKSGFMSHVLRLAIVRLSEGMFDQERLSWTSNEEEISNLQRIICFTG